MEKERGGAAFEIGVLYEDPHVLVIDKPEGVLVHDDGVSGGETVTDWFLHRFPEAAVVGEPQTLVSGRVIARPGIVHRLDRETSGVMILAKTETAFLHLKSQFHDRNVQKEYRAFVYGTMKEEKGIIDKKIGRNARDFRLRSAEYGATGKLRDAFTEWQLLAQNSTHAYIRLLPKTGRTHQLRVHCKAIGRPIVGDRLYAPEHLLNGDNLGIERLALHAYLLTITLLSGEERTFSAPLPAAFETAALRIAEQREQKD
jgi:23S rRNA pseudouridine1911/1915/1917 synthase